MNCSEGYYANMTGAYYETHGCIIAELGYFSLGGVGNSTRVSTNCNPGYYPNKTGAVSIQDGCV